MMPSGTPWISGFPLLNFYILRINIALYNFVTVMLQSNPGLFKNFVYILFIVAHQSYLDPLPILRSKNVPFTNCLFFPNQNPQ